MSRRGGQAFELDLPLARIGQVAISARVELDHLGADGGGVAVLRSVLGSDPGGVADPARAPEPTFLALSVSDAAEDVIALIRAGARGYVTKNIAGTELAEAIARVRGGDAYFSPRLAGFVLDAFGAAAGSMCGQ